MSDQYQKQIQDDLCNSIEEMELSASDEERLLNGLRSDEPSIPVPTSTSSQVPPVPCTNNLAGSTTLTKDTVVTAIPKPTSSTTNKTLSRTKMYRAKSGPKKGAPICYLCQKVGHVSHHCRTGIFRPRRKNYIYMSTGGRRCMFCRRPTRFGIICEFCSVRLL